MHRQRSLLNDVVVDFRACWKSLALTDIVYKVIAFALLTPLVGILFRVLLGLSGRPVLADQDIFFFFLGPIGWISAILVGGLTLAILALEYAALLAVLCAHSRHRRMMVIQSLQFAGANAGDVIRVAARIVVFAALAVAPFIAVGATAYLTLLTEFDINYYLQEKPPAFFVALAIGGIIVIGLSAVMLRLFTSWGFALPVVLFEHVRPRDALRISRQRAHGHRKKMLVWLVGWLVASMALSAITTSIVVGMGRFLVPLSAGAIPTLTLTVGGMLLVWAIAGLAVNLLSTTSFSVILFNLYRRFGCEGHFDASHLNLGSEAAIASRFQLTRKRLLVAGIVGVMVAIAVGIGTFDSVHLVDDVQIIAHRGASRVAPENTMAAIQAAIAEGADWVEIDVQETADDAVVVFHDSDLMKLAGVNLKIWDATLKDLKEIDIGSRFSTEFRDQRVPLLADVLRTCKGRIGVVIELKYYGHDKQLAPRVVDIVEACGMQSEVEIMSLKLDAVQEIKTLRPQWKAGLLMSVAAGDLTNVELDFLAVNAGFVNRQFVETSHQNGRQVYVWTVNDAASMSNMTGRGVDGLITDKPALARSVLKERSAMSAPQRLLLELAEMFGVPVEFREQ